MNAAGKAGKGARDGERDELVGVGGNAHHLGDVFVVVYRKQPRSELGVANAISDVERRERNDQRHQIDRRRRAGPEFGNRHRAERDAGSAVDARVQHDRRDDKRDGQRQQREQFAAHRLDAKHDGTERHAEQRRGGRCQRQGPEKRHAEVRRQACRRVHADAEECAVAERKVTRVARQDVPRQRQDRPVAHEVEERFVKRRDAEPRHAGEQRSDRGDAEGGSIHWRTLALRAGLAGRAGPVARLLARHEQSTGLFVSGLGPPRGTSPFLGRPGERLTPGTARAETAAPRSTARTTRSAPRRAR